MAYLMDQLMQDGRAFGDHEITDDGDFVAYYVDLQQQGVLEMLPVVNAKLARELRARFDRIMNAHILSGVA
jgi:roadblock/LC7 domain-containing protein